MLISYDQRFVQSKCAVHSPPYVAERQGRSVRQNTDAWQNQTIIYGKLAGQDGPPSHRGIHGLALPPKFHRMSYVQGSIDRCAEWRHHPQEGVRQWSQALGKHGMLPGTRGPICRIHGALSNVHPSGFCSHCHYIRSRAMPHAPVGRIWVKTRASRTLLVPNVSCILLSLPVPN